MGEKTLMMSWGKQDSKQECAETGPLDTGLRKAGDI